MKTLKEAYRAYFPIGAAVSVPVLKTHDALIRRHFSSITAENHMKPRIVQPEEGKFYFDEGDCIAGYAKRNSMKLRGHTLVWHHRAPAWFFEKDGSPAPRELVLKRMQNHIEAVVRRYAYAYVWDVVNEAISDENEAYFRKSPWLENIGEDFIAEAFAAAHKADPNALLFYNDYNEYSPVKSKKIHSMVADLLKAGVPIHGIGLQGHYFMDIPGLPKGYPPIELTCAAIELYASLGLQLQITELDVSLFGYLDTTDFGGDPPDLAERMELQADYYAALFKAFRKYAKYITSVTFWGVADDYTWLTGFKVGSRKEYPFLFDAEGKPKKVFERVTDF